ncbi:hypothetical protein [Ruegeria faecimaris]|uniref:hypothetical protein n=1 Tax=Ruegeria faecimaris TaxID=686389 RepID=UPI00249157A2|nr:hypothetical protein [Ruegeria faecimaris]
MTIRSLLTAIPLMVLGWLSVLVVVALITDEAPAYVVVFPSEGLMRNLADDVAVIDSSQVSVTVTSDSSGFAQSLYRQGARLVLPAGLPGCLPLPAQQ